MLCFCEFSRKNYLKKLIFRIEPLVTKSIIAKTRSERKKMETENFSFDLRSSTKTFAVSNFKSNNFLEFVFNFITNV
jgi:hypothetical protein